MEKERARGSAKIDRYKKLGELIDKMSMQEQDSTSNNRKELFSLRYVRSIITQEQKEKLNAALKQAW
jgi:hypothetical protein